VSLVILIFGASGSGKSTLMEYLTRAGNQYSIHRKGTDRAKRNYDGIEIEYVAQVKHPKYDYIYETYGYHYGIQKAQIDAATAAGKHHFIICNDVGVIRRLKHDYGDCVRVIFHHFDAPGDELRLIQQARKISDDEIELRLAKTEVLYRTFVEEQTLFDGVLHNHYGANPEAMVREIERILFDTSNNQHLDRLSRELIDRVSTMAAHLGREQTRPQKEIGDTHDPGYVFIIMPMRRESPNLLDTLATIKRACRAVHMRGGRIDDKANTGQITENIHNNIRLAEYVVADLTDERPNVYYEVGYAHALGKPILLIAKAETNIHFDLQGCRTHKYHSYQDLEEELKKWLRALKKESRRQAFEMQEPKSQ
jgi:guanylate kinase